MSPDPQRSDAGVRFENLRGRLFDLINGLAESHTHNSISFDSDQYITHESVVAQQTPVFVTSRTNARPAWFRSGGAGACPVARRQLGEFGKLPSCRVVAEPETEAPSVRQDANAENAPGLPIPAGKTRI